MPSGLLIKEKNRRGTMAEVGLWIQSRKGDTFLIKKDTNGYPDLISLSSNQSLTNTKEKKEKCKSFYKDLTGKKYAHPDATTRQVLWDFLEVAIRHLP